MVMYRQLPRGPSPVVQPMPRARHAACRPARAARVLPVRCSATTTEMPPSLKNLVGQFQAVADPMQRYKQLLFFATKLAPLEAEAHTAENKVKGCVSQVWVVPQLKDDGKIYWKADSDSQLTKGLAALLVQGLSGCTPEEIVKIQPTFIELLGLQQSLTPSRNNGFLNMFKLMQKKALDLYLQQQASKQEAESSKRASDSAAAAEGQAGEVAGEGGASSNGASASEAASGNGSSSSSTPVADSMRRKLTEQLQPVKLNIVDESHKHAGHAGHRGTANYSGETHFVIEVVSPKFEGLTSIKRHRLVYGIIDAEMGSPVHALSLVTQTPKEAGLA